MSHRSVIAAATYDGWTGRYVHNDGLPVLRISDLMHLVRTVHSGDVEAAVRYLIHDHPAGWMTIPSSVGHPGECLCHNGQGLDLGTITHHTADPDHHTWIYVLHDTHLTFLAADGDQYIHKGDYPWVPETGLTAEGPIKSWRVIYRSGQPGPLLLLAAVPAEDGSDVEATDTELDAQCLTSVTVQSATVSGALRQARAIIDTY